MIKISAFPKCYIDDISVHRTMTVFEWIEMAPVLGAEGLEMYEGFLISLDDAYVDSVGDAIRNAGFAMPMMCCSPDFTNPDAAARARAIEKECEMIRVTRRLGGAGAACRVLSGQRYPEVTRQQGVAWVVEGINKCLPVAREYDIVLAMENHYKDGQWRFTEFAQQKDVFLEIVDLIEERKHFGVQYDPSNAVVAGDDPIELLREVAERVVTMHASDRFLLPGVSLDDLKQSDGTLGYAPGLRHGVTGKGINDYHAIFQILKATGYDGWISIEDGMNGMDEMKDSIDFLKGMRDLYFSN
jgi:sugar phosphate isomerase/epimerase